MKQVFKVLLEQIKNFKLIFRLSKYEMKSKYQMHYLGILWQFLIPFIQISIYWFVFGIGIRQGKPVDGIPFFLWLICGLVPWFFISPTITKGANSVFTKINLVAKMKFPVSVLPTITIFSNGFNFFLMLGIVFLIALFNGIFSGLYLLQLIYYIFCTFILLFSITLLFSSLSVIMRDFQSLLQASMRMLMYLSPILWNTENLPELYQTILKLNPFYYVLIGYRYSFLGTGWFFDDLIYTLYFWLLVITILFIGSLIHLKFRKKFVDYL